MINKQKKELLFVWCSMIAVSLAFWILVIIAIVLGFKSLIGGQ